MKRTVFLISIVTFITQSAVHAQQYQWVKGGGSACNGSIYRLLEKVTNITTDVNKNVYVLGSIGDLSINADTFHLTQGYAGASCNQQLLFASYNCKGQMRFAKFINGYNTAKAYDVEYDGGANIYVAGYINGNGGTIGTGSKRFFGTDTVVNTNNYNSFLIKYDTSGKMKWLRFLGLDVPNSQFTGMSGCSLAFDNSGTLHMFATVSSGIQLTSTIITQGGNYDITYSSSGTVLGAAKLPFDSTYNISNAFFNNKSSTVYFKLDGFYFLGNNVQAIACVKANSIAWIDTTNGYAEGIGGLDYKGGNALYLTLDGQPTSSTFHFGGLSGSNTSFPGQNYAAILRLDTNGVGKWSYKLDGSSGVNIMQQIAILPNGSVATTGSLAQKIKHNSDSIVAPTSESVNPYLLIVDSSGNLVKLDQQHGGGYTDGGVAIASDNSGSIYLGGYYETTMTATGLGAGISSTGGSADFWLMKYGYTCNCVTPAANYNAGLPSGKTVTYTYSGTTTGVDSLVWNFGDGQKQKVASGFTIPLSHTFASNGKYNVCVTAFSQCGTNTACKQTPLGVDGFAALGAVKVYPNPANTYFTIEGAEGATALLTTGIGQKALQFSVNAERQVMDISNLPAGMYLLQITDVKGNRGVMSLVKE